MRIALPHPRCPNRAAPTALLQLASSVRARARRSYCRSASLQLQGRGARAEEGPAGSDSRTPRAPVCQSRLHNPACIPPPLQPPPLLSPLRAAPCPCVPPSVVVLLVLVFFYLLLLGDLVYQKRSPSATSSAIVCEFFAGTCFVTVVGRLLRIANTLDNQTPAHTLARVLCTMAVFLFATT